MTSRPSTAAPILAVLAIVLVSLGAYVGGYFWLGQRIDTLSLSAPTRVQATERRYSHDWLAAMYLPAGWIESLLRRVPVSVGS